MASASIYHIQVAGLISALRFDSRWSYTWLGAAACPYPARRLRELPEAMARSYLLQSLASHIYSYFYTPGAIYPLQETADSTDSANAENSAAYISRLSQANHGHGYWDRDWHYVDEKSGLLRLVKGSLAVWVGEAEYSKEAEQELSNLKFSSIIGTGIFNVRLSHERPKLSPGFYCALGDVELHSANSVQPGGPQILRAYWNMSAEGSIHLMEDITKLLNGLEVPFKLKVLIDQSDQIRCDRAVLYIRKTDWLVLRPQFAILCHKYATYLRDRVPSLTRSLAKGVAVAEDPPGGESFGRHRSYLLAQGLLQAYEDGIRTAQQRFDRVARLFKEAGLEIARPYTGPDTEDDYEPFEYSSSERPGLSPMSATEEQTDAQAEISSHESSRFLALALAIGKLLVKRAIWHGDTCTWVGAGNSRQPASAQYLRVSSSLSGLGPDLYSGTAGVALFLGELGALIGDNTIIRTAFGAALHSLAHASSIHENERTGSYTGWFGIALAILQLESALPNQKLKEGALALVSSLSEETRHFGSDLLSGSAGTVLSLIRLARLLKSAKLLNEARAWGEKLIESGKQGRNGVSWPSLVGPKRRHLTGFSHGTAGIAYALLELYASTGEYTYKAAAESALEYESNWFNPIVRNWPDLRARLDSVKYPSQSVFATHWCHGAPGIALAFLKAAEIIGDAQYLETAYAALDTTAAFCVNTRSNKSDFCLCHGLTGNSELLRYALAGHSAAQNNIAVASRRTWQTASQLVTSLGLSTYAPVVDTWLKGKESSAGLPNRFDYNNQPYKGELVNPSIKNPGLMTGIAGVGLYYLRLYDPDLRSVLV